ncbi:MAG: DUF1838 domain-containing protein [Gammaproteobacteria bacterium]|nr:MAG: DUF1838 domain-containing protein [Gammaproteobacteria bacterium]
MGRAGGAAGPASAAMASYRRPGPAGGSEVTDPMSADDCSSPVDPHRALSRLLAHPDGRGPVYTWFGGHGFAVRGDVEPLQLLFHVEGLEVTAPAVPARRLLLVRDPASEALLERRRNPWTGRHCNVELQIQTVTPLPLSPLMPIFVTRDKVIALLEQHLPGRDSSARQLVASRAALENERIAAVDYVGTWQTSTAWWPWMQMEDESGYLFTRMFLRKYARPGELPPRLKADIDERFPELLE